MIKQALHTQAHTSTHVVAIAKHCTANTVALFRPFPRAWWTGQGRQKGAEMQRNSNGQAPPRTPHHHTQAGTRGKPVCQQSLGQATAGSRAHWRRQVNYRYLQRVRNYTSRRVVSFHYHDERERVTVWPSVCCDTIASHWRYSHFTALCNDPALLSKSGRRRCPCVYVLPYHHDDTTTRALRLYHFKHDSLDT